MAETKRKETKKINLALEMELVPWVSYAAGLSDTSATDYINRAVRRDMEGAQGLGADPDVQAGYAAFLKARPAQPAE